MHPRQDFNLLLLQNHICPEKAAKCTFITKHPVNFLGWVLSVVEKWGWPSGRARKPVSGRPSACTHLFRSLSSGHLNSSDYERKITVISNSQWKRNSYEVHGNSDTVQLNSRLSNINFCHLNHLNEAWFLKIFLQHLPPRNYRLVKAAKTETQLFSIST